jgi:hypothetical protein
MSLDVPTIKNLNKVATAMTIAAAGRAISDFKTAPITDYQCKANVTFNEAALHWWAKGSILLNFIANPMANIVLVGFMTKDEKAFEKMWEMQTTTLIQCLNRNPIYTEGLAFEQREVGLCQ